MALTSATAERASTLDGHPPTCPKCGHPLQRRGHATRMLQPQGGQSLTLPRCYGMCPACGVGLFPLDEELALLPSNLTPRLREAVVRLSTPIPLFAKAAREVAWFMGAQVHPTTARRCTEGAGARLVIHATAEADRAVQPACPTPAGPEVQTTHLSYFSRRIASTACADLATGELHRRGIAGVRRVSAMIDGADWCQTFLDLHAPEAVRILDCAHAVEHLTAIAHTPGADGPLLADTELTALRHALKHDGPAAVLERLREVVATQPENETLVGQLTYLETQAAQMDYPAFIDSYR